MNIENKSFKLKIEIHFFQCLISMKLKIKVKFSPTGKYSTPSYIMII